MTNLLYIKLNFKLNDILTQTDSLIVEKIVVDKNTAVAIGLLSGKQPLYYMSNDIHMSSNFFMGGNEDDINYPYQIEFIDATKNILNGATVLYDFQIDEIETKLYAYRLHLTKNTDGVISEYITEYTTVTYSQLTASDTIKNYIDLYESKPVMTIRNLAYRGRNSKLKYNLTLKEYASDSKYLWNRFNIIDNNINNLFIAVEDFILFMNELHVLNDKIQFIARFG